MTGIAALTILGKGSDSTGYASPYDNRVVRLFDILLHFDQVDLPTLALGLATVAAIVLRNRTVLSRYALPIALALVTAAVWLLGLDTVLLVGQKTEIPRSLFRLQAIDLAMIPAMFLPALAIAIAALVQASRGQPELPKPGWALPRRFA